MKTAESKIKSCRSLLISDSPQPEAKKGRVALKKPDKNGAQASQINSIASEIATLSQHISSAQQKLDSLAQRLVMVLEEERRECGRELHDEIGQDLTLLNLAFAQASRSGSVDWPVLQKQLSHLILKVRNFSYLLYGVNIDRVGLPDALREMVQTVTTGTGLTVQTRLEKLPPLPEEIGVTCYRLVQEALTNVLRHSQASQVKVQVWNDDSGLNIQVTDRGVGFDPEAVHKGGLNIMSRRVEMLGGTLDITSRPGRGTVLLANFPFRHIR